MRALKVGVQLPEVEYEYTWPQLAEMARIAESIGLDSIWLGDHLMYRYADTGSAPRGPFEAWTTLGALAAVTTRVLIGPLVASLGFHSPVMVAKKAATVDRISNGRLILGIGSGWHEPEYRAYGFPFERRVSRFAEAFTIIRELFNSGTCNFHGEFYTIEEATLFPKPVQPGGPPLMVGSTGPRMLAITLPHVPMWNAWHADYGNSQEGLANLLKAVDRACEQHDRDPATLIQTVCPLVHMPGGIGRQTAYGTTYPPLDGTNSAHLAEELTAYAELGVAHVQLVLDPITADSIARLEPMLQLLET
ncbi:MAG: LLM class flavin-dependent oxidoreductase [Chloroflexota bacterium]|nr:LLM class flavin-dependent oxidoreductase [Chloroflexota bacterium]